ncbi:protein PERCC1 [Cyclopterus lumpus]|uniref:protein PERCC1 n=1 Tax=Cyclopterus lumpus TaxID=8103 RepID=UPI001485F669|nr:protein PERCC1 [Cyclopterus lumpus]XP_034400341.1 protein PERCC1 [Cyclopterus lumpus]XP_034400351.1 protein PERCC1 [Cyclopterus lumpus]
MAADVIRNFLIQAPTPAYFPLVFQHSPCKEAEDVEMLEDKPEMREDEEEREGDEEEEEDDEEEEDESEAQEEEEGCLEVFLNPAHYALDVTKQLLRFADLISRDVQRYFGRCSGDQEACDIYSDSVSVTTSGRLRYYDDLLKIARAGSPEVQENRLKTGAEDQGVGVAKGNSSLGPLAELFNQRGHSQGRGRPMVKRLLPLSFWTEPIPCCSPVSFSSTPDVTHTHSDTPSQASDAHAQHSAHADSDAHAQHSAHEDSDTHTLDNPQLDFSDLLAYWDPNPELTHTLTENTHMQH